MQTAGLILFTVVLMSAVLVGSGAASVAGRELDDRQILQLRAAFLLNFMKFTTWPADAFASGDSELVVAVIGDDPFGQVLEQTFDGQRVGERSIGIKRWTIPDREAYETDEAFEDAVAELRRRIEGVHVAYVIDCRRAALDLVLDQADLSRVLTVGHERACAERGTALALDRDDDRIVFFANVRTIESLDLQVSSRLLSLARIVEDREVGRQGGAR